MTSKAHEFQQTFIKFLNEYLNQTPNQTSNQTSNLNPQITPNSPKNLSPDIFPTPHTPSTPTPTPHTLLQNFNSSLQFGLTSAQVQINGELYGKNQYRKRKQVGLCSIFYQAISDQLLVILMIAAVVSVGVEYFGGRDRQLFWVDGVSILLAVIICTIVSTTTNHQKQSQFHHLSELSQTTYTYTIIRNGNHTQVHHKQIVPGDIILIETGMQIPADCLLLRGINVVVDQSTVTGESVEVFKQGCHYGGDGMEVQVRVDSVMVSGASVVSGEGVMMAVVVGTQSQAGKNYELIFSKDDTQAETPLQKKLIELGLKIGHVGIASAVLIIVILVSRLLIEQLKKQQFDYKGNLQKLIGFLITGVAVIVLVVPQGLPLAVTLTLAYSMRAMYNDKILVRRLSSCETMGSAKYICSDKTGTITQNKMQVTKILIPNLPTPTPIPQFPTLAPTLTQPYLQLLLTSIHHNTSAILRTGKGPQTQLALLQFAQLISSQSEEDVRKSVGEDGYFLRVPFDSGRKRMTTGVRKQGQFLVFVAGASQDVLGECGYWRDGGVDRVVVMDAAYRKRILNQIQQMASQGLRTVSIAYKTSNLNPNSNNHKTVETNLTLLAVFGIEDPPRPQSKQSIQNCKKAGIHVIMVTGDSKKTGESIARQVGIVTQGREKVLDAWEFMGRLEVKGLLRDGDVGDGELGEMEEEGREGWEAEKQNGKSRMKKIYLGDEEHRRMFEQQIENLAVLSRSKPQHKYILVDGISKLNHIVAVTGDGANDAPALMRADIGLAMGMTGTQVAKNASDIVLLDDNFQSIVRSVIWGRNVYMSIRKFLQVQITASVVTVTMSIISAIFLRESLFTAVQMLWVNLIINSLAALALATEPPNSNQLLLQQPNSPTQKFITKTMIKHIVLQSVFQVAALTVLLFSGFLWIPEFVDGFDEVIGDDLSAKYYNGIPQGTIADGRPYSLSGTPLYLLTSQKYHNPSRHLTLLFNTYTFFQIFNFLCSRKIQNELSVFQGITKSPIFCCIFVLIVGLQVLIVTFGGRWFGVYEYSGLTLLQWMVSVGVGAGVVGVSMLGRLVRIGEEDRRGVDQSSVDRNQLND